MRKIKKSTVTTLNNLQTKDKEKIFQIIKKSCAFAEKDICEYTEIKSLSLDSLSFIQLIVEIEEKFEIEFSDEELIINNYYTVADIFSLVEDKKHVL